MFDKNTAEISKNEEINRKKAKINLKNQEIRVNFEFEKHFHAMQNTKYVYQFPRFTFHYSIEIKLFLKKTKVE